MMQITFIRNLPTKWNLERRLQGRKDLDVLPPSRELLQGMKHNIRHLKKLIPFDIILTSGLKRTQQTAAIYGFKSVSDTLLDELDFGPFEGQPEEELRQTFGEKWLEQPKSIVLGESVAELEERIIEFIAKYGHLTNLLIFGHDAWIRALISYSLYNHINQMNKITVSDHACFTMSVNAK